MLHHWPDDRLPAPHHQGQGGQDQPYSEPRRLGSRLSSGLPSGVRPVLD